MSYIGKQYVYMARYLFLKSEDGYFVLKYHRDIFPKKKYYSFGDIYHILVNKLPSTNGILTHHVLVVEGNFTFVMEKSDMEYIRPVVERIKRNANM